MVVVGGGYVDGLGSGCDGSGVVMVVTLGGGDDGLMVAAVATTTGCWLPSVHSIHILNLSVSQSIYLVVN